VKWIVKWLIFLFVIIKVTLYKRIWDFTWYCTANLHDDVLEAVVSLIRLVRYTTIAEEPSHALILDKAFVDGKESMALVLFLHVRYTLYKDILFSELASFCRFKTIELRMLVNDYQMSINATTKAIISFKQESSVELQYTQIYPEKKTVSITHPVMFNVVDLSLPLLDRNEDNEPLIYEKDDSDI
jgi:hypothetical protein